MSQPQISIIVPIYNEAGNITPLVHKLTETLSTLAKPYEIILVNDGSTDASAQELTQITTRVAHTKVITFTRNFGQTAAFAAGIDQAQGSVLITLDADLQNDPQDIPRMVELMEQKKVDIVAGWRKNRQDPFLRSALSQFANRIIQLSTKAHIHDTGCSLRVYKKQAIDHIHLYGEMHRFIPALAVAAGASIIETPVVHHLRQRGHSKYGFIRTFKVLLDLLTVKYLIDFQTKPIYMFGFIGFSFIGLSAVLGALITLRRLVLGGVWISPLFIIAVFLGMFGFLSILLGLLAEIQLRSWYESSNKKGYIIKKTSAHASKV